MSVQLLLVNFCAEGGFSQTFVFLEGKYVTVAQEKLLSYHLPGVKIWHAPEVADMCLNFISTNAMHPACQLYNIGS